MEQKTGSMRTKRKYKPAFDKLEVFTQAMVYAYVDNASFTPVALANKCHCSDTRHFRAYLAEIARKGILLRSKVLFSDGHYRYLYMGQLTRQLPFVYAPGGFESES